MSTLIVKRPNAFVYGQNVGTTAFVDESFETSPFWGLFEGNASPSEPVDVTADPSSSSDGPSIVTGILGLLGGGISTLGQLAPVLPALGIGSKSRIAETAANKDLIEAQAAATLASQKEQEKNTTMYIAGGILFMVMIVVIIVASKAL